MSDRALATYYLQASRFDTTKEIRGQLDRLKGQKLPVAGKLVRAGLRRMLAVRKAA